MARWVSVTLVVCFSALLAGAGNSLSAATGKPPSIVLISVDTLRADHLSCYGYRRISTPHLDALARGGTLFSAVSSQVPLTFPSHVSLFTSTYPFFNGIEDNGETLRPNALTLATVLVTVATLLFPYTPLGAMFGFKALPLYFFPLLAVIVGIYIFTAEAAKKIFYRRITF